MSCKYCGKSTENGVVICAECNSILAESSNVKAKKPLYWVIFVGVLLPAVVSSIYSIIYYFRYIDLVPNYGRKLLFSELTTLSSNGYIWFVILVVLIVIKKIDTHCCEREDAILWIGMRWVGAFFPITSFVQTMMAYRGNDFLAANSTCNTARNIFEMPGLWINICLISFLMVRSGKMEFHKKKMILIPCVLVVWSLLIVIFQELLLQEVLEVSPEIICSISYQRKFSAMFMWLRYLILMWFAVSWAKKQIGFVCVTLCIMCFRVLPGMLQIVFIESEAPLALWGDSNIAYIVAGIILVISKCVNRRSTVQG